MGNYAKFYDGNPDDLVYVIGFDPGGTTGWCVLGVEPEVLGSVDANMRLSEALRHVEYGTIDCDPPVSLESQMHQGHPGLNLAGENEGVSKMLDMATVIYPKSVVVVEDFIVDFNQITSGREALSPVRLISAFSYGLWREDHGILGGGLGLPGSQTMSRIWVQNRSLAKTTCTDTRLKHWKLYDQSSGPHARDATRHAFYFLRKLAETSVAGAEMRWRCFPNIFSDPAATVYVPGKGRKPIDSKKINPRPLGERI